MFAKPVKKEIFLVGRFCLSVLGQMDASPTLGIKTMKRMGDCDGILGHWERRKKDRVVLLGGGGWELLEILDGWAKTEPR